MDDNMAALLPYRTRPFPAQATPPSPASPSASHHLPDLAQKQEHEHQPCSHSTHADAVLPLPTPPITPVKPAVAEMSHVVSLHLDLASDAALPAEARAFIGQLQVGVLLGEGQWARVFYALDHGTGRVCAVKVPRPSKSGEPACVLRHEAQVLTFLSNHARSTEHIVTFLGLDHASGALVLDYAPATLEALVQSYPAGTPLATDPLIGTQPFLRLARSLISSTAWIHAQGIVHGDIKPRNILLPSGSLESMRLADFSSARLASDVAPRPGDTCTTAYAAPELLRSFRGPRRGVPTMAADLWGAAASLLFAGTGEEPYSDIPHVLGRLAEATRGTVWAHMRNGQNVRRVREGGVLWCALAGVLLRDEESTRWNIVQWMETVDALIAAAAVESEG